jgi:cytochrome c oxidase subunit 2
VLLLLFLIVASVFTDRALAQLSLKDAVRIEITANQWWWTARYDDDDPSRTFTTANELHIPVGPAGALHAEIERRDPQPVGAQPAGKKDLIPGPHRDPAVAAPTSPASTAASAPSSAASSTRSWPAGGRRSAGSTRPGPQAQRRTAAASDRCRPCAAALFLGGTCVMCHTVQGTLRARTAAPT